MRNAERGFTLMELMVVMVIIGILAAVAVPLYINYVHDATRTEAKGAIGAVVTAEQTFYQQNGRYTTDNFVPNPGPTSQNLNCDLTDALHNWDITITAADENGFTVMATGRTGTNAANLTQQLVYSRTGGSTWTPQ